MAALPARYSGINFTPPKGVREACARGVAWVEEGNGGDGLEPETIAWARKFAKGEKATPEKIRLMPDWFARHESDQEGEGYAPGEKGYPSPGRVAWALWGDDPGWTWAKKIEAQMDAADSKEKGKEVKKAMETMTVESAPEVAKVALGPVALQFFVDTYNATRRAGLPHHQALHRSWDALWSVGFCRAPDGTYLRAEDWAQRAEQAEQWYTPAGVKQGEGEGEAAAVALAGRILSKSNAAMLKEIASGMEGHAGQIRSFLKGCGYGEEEDVEDGTTVQSSDSAIQDRLVAVRHAETDQRLVSGWASLSTDARGRAVVDSNGWVVPVETLRSAIHNHLRHGNRAGNDEHGPDQQAELVEALVIDGAVRVALGLPAVGETGLWVTYRVTDDALWQQVKAGKKMCFSIEGEGLLYDT